MVVLKMTHYRELDLRFKFLESLGKYRIIFFKEDKNMKFGGHQSFHLRDQWLYKGIYWWTNQSSQLSLRDKKVMDKAMKEMGVGKNMVDSIKYWLIATKLIELDNKGSESYSIARKTVPPPPPPYAKF